MSWPVHIPTRCILCGKVGARTFTLKGYAHKRCLKEEESFSKVTRPGSPSRLVLSEIGGGQ